MVISGQMQHLQNYCCRISWKLIKISRTVNFFYVFSASISNDEVFRYMF